MATGTPSTSAPDTFRALALALPGASEGAHMGHADFRVNGRIFATLGSPDEGWAMVKLPPEEQAMRVEAAPDVFTPAPGAWGRDGSTRVRLAAADAATLFGALACAHAAAVAKPKRRSKPG